MRQLIVVLGFVAQFLDVGPALLALLSRIALKKFFVAAALENHVDDVEHRPVGQLLPSRLDDVGEHPEHFTRPHGEGRLSGERVAAPGGPQGGDSHKGLIRGDGLLGRPAQQVLHRFLADPTGRQIDDTLQADGVERVVNQAQVGQHVFDFTTLVEPHAAYQAVGRTGAHKLILEGSGLSVGAVQNPEIVQWDALRAVQALDLAQNIERFVLFVIRLMDSYRRARVVVGPERLLFAQFIRRDDGARDLQNGAGRAIVLFEHDDLEIGKVVLEVQNVANIGAAPGINRLVFVADNAQITAFFGQELDDFVLDDVGVLKLVDHNVLEAALVKSKHFRNFAEQVDRYTQEIVEIQGMIALQQFVVALVDARNRFLPLTIGAASKRFAVEQLALGVRDRAQYGPR